MTELARGLYRIVSKANLRFRRKGDGTYPILEALEPGALVYAVGGNPYGHQSYFDGNAASGTADGAFVAGGWRNDHTWVVAISTLDYEGSVAQGWIDNGKMEAVHDEVASRFRDGDVLYGRSEAREPWTGRLIRSEIPVPIVNQTVASYRYNIIDNLNKAIINKKINDEDVEAFADWLGEAYSCEATSVRIRKMCKAGLTYITTVRKHTVHFVLDGLDATRVLAEASVDTKLGVQDHSDGPQKYCTGAEMRRLMRQKMSDLHLRYGKNYDIDLNLVCFYLSAKRVPAPWDNGAPGKWPETWTGYQRYRQSKKNTI